MKSKINTNLRRILSGCAAFAMASTLMPSISVFAQTGKTVYSFDGYDVEYNVVNEWEEGQSVEVKITNTSDESLYNWAIKYDAEGTISRLWNASVVDSDETDYVIRNKSYNYEIKPDQSVKFGYTLSDDDYITPDDFELCSVRKDLTDGYTVDIQKDEVWEDGIRGHIVINNTSDSPIEAWKLCFDSNITIEDIWNADIISHEDNHYTIDCQEWSNPIPAGESVSIGFRGSFEPETEPDINAFSLSSVVIDYDFNPNVEGSIALSADKTEILAADGSETVYIYASTDAQVPSISLVDSQSGEVIGQLVDDGNYSVSGDDMQGDGVYSYKALLDKSEAKDYYFTAEYSDETTVLSSDTLNIHVYSELTDIDNSEIAEVSNKLQELRTSPEFDEMTLAQRAQAATALLTDLAVNGTEDFEYGLVDEDSICYIDQMGVVTFSHSCGVLACVILVDDDELFNGAGDVTGDEGTNSYVLDSSLSSDVPDEVGSALVLYAFDDTIGSSRYPHYLDYEEEWESKGLDTVIDTDVTVTDFKESMAGNSVVVFAMHGGYLPYKTVTGTIEYAPMLGTLETATSAKNIEYQADLMNKRIIVGTSTSGSHYLVLPDLFSDTYQHDELDNSTVFMENCCGYGEDGTVDYSMAEALEDAGVEVTVGFHNSVFAIYSRDMMSTYVDNLLDSMTAYDALEDCKAQFGDDHEEWYFSMTGVHSGYPVAYPILYGDENFVLYNSELKNGSFESASATGSYNTVVSWKDQGDARVLPMLGDLYPVDGSHMAIITTGVGSAESDYLAGTEGSSISQQFKIPDGATTLSFTYNVVSEEPTEWVGTQYDDEFSAKIFDVHSSEVMQIAHETVNTSQWYAVSGIDFDGGDHTCYQTGWKTVTVDVSACGGRYITLKFGVVDKGDSIYDTAALIDNVVIS
ncbi:MAG: cellulose binding domain-containing protein [Oscillospiraceae bacterium]|nr:cellulose binding domain-containing protein [Oscillospiraceae bacterium]